MTARDPGLQRERTTLAWSRTGFSAVLVAVLAGRAGLVHHSPALLAAAGCAAVVPAAGWIRRRRDVPRVAVVAAAAAVAAAGLASTAEFILLI